MAKNGTIEQLFFASCDERICNVVFNIADCKKKMVISFDECLYFPDGTGFFFVDKTGISGLLREMKEYTLHA